MLTLTLKDMGNMNITDKIDQEIDLETKKCY